MVNKRIEYLDTIKGFSVLWVVLYHFGLPSEIINAPYRLPIFFLISGFFFRERSCFKDFFVKKVNTLLIPFFFFWIFGIGMRLLLSIASFIIGGEFDFSLKYFFLGFGKLFTIIPVDAVEPNPLGIGAIWFLLALFCLQMIYYGLLKISKDYLFLITVAVLAYFLSYWLIENVCALGTFLYIPYVLRFLIYYIVGHLGYRSYLDFIENSRYRLCILCSMVVALIMTITSNHWLETQSQIFWGGVNLAIQIIETLLFTGIVTVLFRYAYRWRIMGLFTFFGKNSIVIFATHMAIMPFVVSITERLMSITSYSCSNVVIAYPIIIYVCYLLTILCIKYLPFLIGKQDLIKLNFDNS